MYTDVPKLRQMNMPDRSCSLTSVMQNSFLERQECFIPSLPNVKSTGLMCTYWDLRNEICILFNNEISINPHVLVDAILGSTVLGHPCSFREVPGLIEFILQLLRFFIYIFCICIWRPMKYMGENRRKPNWTLLTALMEVSHKKFLI
jgi:hypothetical protein